VAAQDCQLVPEDEDQGLSTALTGSAARAAAGRVEPLRWHDLRHEGACRLHVDGVDIRIIQLILGHASIQQTQRYLNVTDEELRKGLEVSWKNQGRPLRLASAGN
jgi:site-specific recombinase XerD